MKDDITEVKDAQITAKIPRKVKMEMQTLVKEGMFHNLSECTRTAINRLLKEIDDHIEEENKKDMNMEELKRFVEELGELYK